MKKIRPRGPKDVRGCAFTIPAQKAVGKAFWVYYLSNPSWVILNRTAIRMARGRK